MKGLIGVLGGMGPAATVDMFNKFVTFTSARRDQQHIPLLISSIPDIPDRSAALMQEGHSPLPAMRDYLQRLEQAGAECIVIPCNTAHFWFDELRQSCHVELLNIVGATLNEVCASGQRHIGLLATDATLYMGLYQQAIEAHGLRCIAPDRGGQEQVMESIYALKAGDAGHARRLMARQADALFARGAQIIVLGCTEVPVILAKALREQPERYIESTGALVRAGIRWYEKRVGQTDLLAQ
ncbi:aspartate/glutamate racemase family protein [Edwardsiella ictaluri]|uniref:Aspartate racemase, putative n=2 Tax=Edwardsiella ictaluri TaxID=67780 RepID=C5BBI1_EDWI9|nr:amino acid racemase [Edwardsiella ictaluri]ACR68212.1 aspartate racemase, putative [Edwardsiella ictaluri 93-146]AVZ81410.1 aspartate/glutamate racemase family protein [Edwardsiella ictaluri]EKS7762645.1 aspartate/glutamate racemase family protein [Edwardsiella ictaluri]EKS7769347.1 aspartate/glutamate racemase family protein [Edwardsiella ictaluri]EKS7772496.1 aspartate/glutamate racemase family protein [Edwardsiella ictaluri]